ncbi:Flp pilus assembly protein CpaB [Desulfotruncus alcoholivorax]|uniref:Flp pilus assembly protein CpaB n=1 Tax=Desulfotruncus alcoholivorax TaxID=265477 RepID=UPI0012FEEB9D|nr:Flp pilus assembly protein CpaB [Desulfotruncus alcoholivorax]
MAKTLSIKKPFVMKNSGSYLLLIGLILAGFVAYGVVNFLYMATNSVPVVVAKNKIMPYTVIKADDLEIKQLPRAAVQPTMFPAIQPIVGKYARTVIPAGYPVSADVFTEGNSASGSLTAVLNELNDKTLRAKSFPIDKVGALNGKIGIGDKVDVIGAMKLPLGGVQQPMAQIIARDVPVLDQFDGGITLALTPQQAQDLQFALIEGTISLQLCGADADSNAANTSVTTADDFVRRYLKLPRLPVEENKQK